MDRFVVRRGQVKHCQSVRNSPTALAILTKLNDVVYRELRLGVEEVVGAARSKEFVGCAIDFGHIDLGD